MRLSSKHYFVVRKGNARHKKSLLAETFFVDIKKNLATIAWFFFISISLLPREKVSAKG